MVAVASFIVNIYLMKNYPEADFFLPFSRFWELMAGGILAYIVLHRPRYLFTDERLKNILSFLGLVLIGGCVIFISKADAFPGWLALLPIVGSFLVIYGESSWINRRFLSNKLLVFVGLISYPLYLWHWPLLSYVQIIEHGVPDRLLKIGALVSSFMLAWLTYSLVEKRFKKKYTNSTLAFLSLAMLLLLIVGSIILIGVLPPRQNSKNIERIVSAIDDRADIKKFKTISVDNVKFPILEGAKTKTVFLGDSHVAQYVSRIDKILFENSNYNTAVFATGGDCLPIPNTHINYRKEVCSKIRNAAINYINHPDVKTVVIGAFWTHYFQSMEINTGINVGDDVGYYYLGHDQIKHSFKYGDGVELATRELESFLVKLASNKQVFLLLDNPSGDSYSPKSLLNGSRFSKITIATKPGQNTFAKYPHEQDVMRDKLTKIAQRLGIKVIDPSLKLCVGDRCLVTNLDGDPIYYDSNHLRPYYVEKFANYIDSALM